ncbi:MAG: hypothetical protein PQJ46_04725 [Spirochaetales bacterium]|nr:hypothetical protein [Spirochaetales bacterium]
MKTNGGRMPESYQPGDMNFHYNREEREAMLSEETKKAFKKSGFFSLNKRNLIILADILVIIIITMIFMPLSMTRHKNAKIDGFRATLNAYSFDGQVLVSLKVIAPEDNKEEAGIVSAKFHAGNSDEIISDMDLLPQLIEKPRILRAEFSSGEPPAKKAYADIEINGKTKNLSVNIKTE